MTTKEFNAIIKENQRQAYVKWRRDVYENMPEFFKKWEREFLSLRLSNGFRLMYGYSNSYHVGMGIRRRDKLHPYFVKTLRLNIEKKYPGLEVKFRGLPDWYVQTQIGKLRWFDRLFGWQ